MTVTLIILFVTAVLFVWGKFRSDIVALIALIAFSLCGILTPQEVLSGFSNPIVLMIAGLFIISGAVNQTGLAKTVSTQMLQMAGKNETKLFLLTMIVAAFLSSFMTNYGTVALLLPIVVGMTREAKMSIRRFLMPMAFASSMGGMMTLIGTPANLIIDNQLRESGLAGLGFFTVMPVGVILLLLGLFFLWILSKILKKNEKRRSSGYGEVKSPGELMREYQLADNLFRVKMNAKAPIIGKKLQELGITQKYNVSIIEIRTHAQTTSRFLKSVYQHLADAETILHEDDIIYVTGKFDDVERFVIENYLTFLDSSHSESDKRPEFSGKMKFDDIGVAEAVVLSSSRLVDKYVKDSVFRKRYRVNILGIKRKKEYIFNKVQHETIQAGDSLLIQGSWGDIKELDDEKSDLVVVGHPEHEASKVTLEHKATSAAVILLAMVLTIVSKLLEPVIAVMLAAMLMILFGCFKNEETAYRTIKWQNIVFLAAMIPVTTAMNKTGTSETISHVIVNIIGHYGPYAVLAAVYIGASFLTMFISNAASVILFAPIALQSAQALDVSPYPFLFAVATSASMCLASPYASPPNSLVMSPGRYSFADYVKVGLPLQIIYVVVMVFVLPLIFPF